MKTITRDGVKLKMVKGFVGCCCCYFGTSPHPCPKKTDLIQNDVVCNGRKIWIPAHWRVKGKK